MTVNRQSRRPWSWAKWTVDLTSGFVLIFPCLTAAWFSNIAWQRWEQTCDCYPLSCLWIIRGVSDGRWLLWESAIMEEWSMHLLAVCVLLLFSMILHCISNEVPTYTVDKIDTHHFNAHLFFGLLCPLWKVFRNLQYPMAILSRVEIFFGNRCVETCSPSSS